MTDIIFKELDEWNKVRIEEIVLDLFKDSDNVFWWTFIDEILIINWSKEIVFHFSSDWEDFNIEDVKDILNEHYKKQEASSLINFDDFDVFEKINKIYCWLIFLQWQKWSKFDILIEKWPNIKIDWINSNFLILLNNKKDILENLQENKYKRSILWENINKYTDKMIETLSK